MNRKYHSGLMPAGADANGSALTPRFHGKMAAKALSTPKSYIPGHQFPQQEVGEEFHFPLRRRIHDPFFFQIGMHADAQALHQQEMHKDQRGRQAGQHGDVKAEEPVSVAPVTSSPPRRKIIRGLPIKGTWSAMSVPTLVAKKARVFQGSK